MRQIDQYLNRRVLIRVDDRLIEYKVDEISPSRKYIRLSFWKTFDDGSILNEVKWMNVPEFKACLVEVL